MSETQRIVIRADASIQMGSGHVMRCLALADELKKNGVETTFVSREHPGHLCELIESAGHPLLRLPAPTSSSSGNPAHAQWLGVSQEDDARQTLAVLTDMSGCDWLVVDHYALDASWETAMRPRAKNIMAIDDLADRKHDCDLLLDQNYYDDMDTRYDELVPPDCVKLLGPKFALLRPEFSEARKNSRQRDGSVRRIFIFFGGSDPPNETGKALEAIKFIGRPNIAVDVVVGAANPNQENITNLCAALPEARLYCQVNNIAELMAQADIAIGAGGGAVWERCCVGLPAIVISIAENQRAGSEAVARSGRTLYLGEYQAVSVELLQSALELVCSSPYLLTNMSESGMGLVDGNGVERVVRQLAAKPILLRMATENDCDPIYRWRNAEETRLFSGDVERVSFENHMRWYKDALADPSKIILIGEIGGDAVGVLRYDQLGERATVSVYLVPDNHGKGIGTALIKQGALWLKENWPAIKIIDAQIKAANIASIAAFTNAGFDEQYRTYSKRIRN